MNMQALRVKQISSTRFDQSILSTRFEAVLTSTGMVNGEFGFAEAFERKREEIAGWLDAADPRVSGFASRYIEDINERIEAERKHASERTMVRRAYFDSGN